MGKVLWNDLWEFTSVDISTDVEEVRVGDENWVKVDIPHDMVIDEVASFYKSQLGIYRKKFFVHKGTEEVYNRSIICFDGVYMNCSVYVNGSYIGDWKYGYSSFEFDISHALVDGENEVRVLVRYETPNSRWYSGAGIYRNVWFKQLPLLHIPSDGVYLSTLQDGDSYQLTIQTELVDKRSSSLCNEIENKRSSSLHNELEAISSYTIVHTLLDANGYEVVMNQLVDEQSKEEFCNIQKFVIPAPKVWDILHPYLYSLHTKLIKDNKVIQEEMNRFGFRTIAYDPDEGFFLNGRVVKLHGVCQHHDLGALGAAFNKAALKRQLLLLKEMGVNAIRPAHNMCAVELLDLCDELGLLVNNESFDMWERPKTSYDYARFFNEWVDKDVASWVRRDRNHPCVIMWCIGNEISDTHVDESGVDTTKRLLNLVHQYDPNHNAAVTIGSNYMPWENARKCADVVKLAGYNYAEKYYEKHHKEHPDWIIYGSETGSIVQSRGIYHFPLEKEILSDDDEQCSSLGNSITSWGARSIEKCITDDRDASFSAGMFIWSGFDYIGEPTPYHTKNSYFGQLDTAGFKKDSFYIYQSAWTDYKVAPMVHIFPYWDFNEGQMIDVRVCSNAPKVELFLNSVSQGVFYIDQRHGKQLVGNWKIPYIKGELLALAYDEEEKIIATDRTSSFTDAAKIVLKADKNALLADGEDMIFIEITMEDSKQNPVHNANNRVFVNVTGAGRLVGIDNGDSTDYDSYKGNSKRLFSGKLLAMIGAKTSPGPIQVEVSSMGLPTTTLELESISSHVEQGISAFTKNKESAGNLELPVRKLEIVSEAGTKLGKGLEEIEIEVKLHPKDASYDEIIYRVTDANGVDTNIASIVTNGKTAKVQVFGDGIFYVRAATRNGGKKINRFSILDFQVSGLGIAYFNPYEFISGSLYAQSFGEIGSGNERGIATQRDGESGVFYDRLDFGAIGSDVITLPVFELASKPTEIEIWEGKANEKESTLLCKGMYHKKSIWNTYQEESYKLCKKLKGITSLSFLLRDKVHLKGFYFEKPNKAYERLSILSYDSIYGDSFTITDVGIHKIGNNVTIGFRDMDFMEAGSKKLFLCGRSNIDSNPILIRFAGKEEESTQMIDFAYSTEEQVKEFEIKLITGVNTVEFIFLPGCNFDFHWFQFMPKE